MTLDSDGLTYHPMRYFLYGPPGSGKSQLGKALAAQLEMPFLDLDEQIVIQSGRTIPQIFAEEGEASFRRIEKATLREICVAPPAVVALGGGALLDDENRQWVEAAGQVLFLDAPYSLLIERLSDPNQPVRPLLADPSTDQLAVLLQRRQVHYASFPLRLDTARVKLDELVWQAQIALGAFRVKGMGAAYDVRVFPGGLGHLHEIIPGAVGAYPPGCPIALVSDQNLVACHVPIIEQALVKNGYQFVTAILAAGEETKNLASVMRLWDAFLEGKLERGSLVLALGGGVVSDLAGFAAATYLRGVRWIALPTTLLAMCDASLGGKTGIDLPQGKNLVGAFHAPSLVLADPLVLRTLPECEFRNGLAEVVKHGVIGDPVLFEMLGKGLDYVHAHIEEIVRRAVAVKVRVICEDPYEQGSRASLNLGHTIGHALEVVSGYRIKHGESVAIGMVQAARMAVQAGLARPELADQLSATLRILGLPTEIPGDMDRAALAQAMQMDKKRAQSKLRFVLPIKIGEVQTGVEINWVK